MRPSSAMRSSRLRLSTTVSACCCSLAVFGSAAMLALLLLAGVDTGFGSGLPQQFLILDYLLQQVLQLFVADEAGAQVGQAVPQLEQLAQRRDLFGDLRRLKIVHALKTELDVQLGVILAEAVGHFEGQPRADLLHHIV